LGIPPNTFPGDKMIISQQINTCQSF